MKPFEIDGFKLDLYKGGNGQVILTIMDSETSLPGHIDIDLSTLLHALGVLLPRFAAPVPMDADLETSPNEPLEAP